MLRRTLFRAVLVCAASVHAAASLAQPSPAAGARTGGSPNPVPPAVVAVDDAGHVTLRATRITQPMKTDGRLDEPVYEQVEPIGGFISIQPVDGAPISERTDV